METGDIKYDLDGGKEVDSSDKYPTYYTNGTAVKVKDIGKVSKDGFDFLGWKVEPGDGTLKTKEDDILIDADASTDVKLTAVWGTKKITADVKITKEVPAGTYGIYDENKDLIAELESDDEGIIETVIKFIGKLGDTVVYYIKQLDILDDTLNADNKYYKFDIVATGSELTKGPSTKVEGLDKIKFNNTKKVASPSEIPEEDNKSTPSEIPEEDSNKSENKKNKEKEDKPLFDGDWLDLNGKNMNSANSKAGGARFKIDRTNMYIMNEARVLPVHGRYGTYHTYRFDHKGNLVYGWAKDPKTHQWHYFDETGAEVYGWKYIEGKWYFFNDDMTDINRGEMFKSCNYGGYRLGEDGALIGDEIPKNAPLYEVLKATLDNEKVI